MCVINKSISRKWEIESTNRNEANTTLGRQITESFPPSDTPAMSANALGAPFYPSYSEMCSCSCAQCEIQRPHHRPALRPADGRSARWPPCSIDATSRSAVRSGSWAHRRIRSYRHVDARQTVHRAAERFPLAERSPAWEPERDRQPVRLCWTAMRLLGECQCSVADWISSATLRFRRALRHWLAVPWSRWSCRASSGWWTSPESASIDRPSGCICAANAPPAHDSWPASGCDIWSSSGWTRAWRRNARTDDSATNVWSIGFCGVDVDRWRKLAEQPDCWGAVATWWQCRGRVVPWKSVPATKSTKQGLVNSQNKWYVNNINNLVNVSWSNACRNCGQGHLHVFRRRFVGPSKRSPCHWNSHPGSILKSTIKYLAKPCTSPNSKI